MWLLLLAQVAVDTDRVAVVVDSRVDTWDTDYMAMVDKDCRKAFAGQQ